MDNWIDINKSLFKTKNDIKEIDITDLNIQAIRNSINNIFRIRLGELPGEPEFGSRIHEYLFSQLDISTRILIENDMTNVLRRWEPRIEVISLDTELNPDYNEIICSLKFKVISDPENKVFEHRLSFEAR